MDYLSTWKVLEEMIKDFRKKGLTIPAKIMNDLKSAKIMLKILKEDQTHGETLQKTDFYLGTVESYLVSEGQKQFGAEYADEWLKHLNEASRMSEEEKTEIRFVSGLPREHKWIRVKPSTELPIEKLKMLIEELSLSYAVQKDGYVLVYGKDTSIKDFVKKMATKHRTKV